MRTQMHDQISASSKSQEHRQVPTPTPAPSAAVEKAAGVPSAEREQRDLESYRSEHNRDQITRHIFAVCIWVLMVLVFTILIAAVFTLGVHYLAPENLHWLGDEALQRVKDFVLSGAIVSMAVTFMRRYLE